ncbi:MAG TPA: squalene/phytoene synthase family protein [Thermoanaerobaculia bacterium]|nr:squalene/phytoene synthase family protein [Thermoanaerobaculia bacterium]
MNGSDPLRDAYALAESIASRDLNNLYLTSRFFADPVRFRAFCAYYAVMRRVDDRVDELCARSAVPPPERELVRAEVDAWRRAIAAVGAGEPPESAGRALAGLEDAVSARALLLACEDAHRSFRVPAGLWLSFFAAMERDLEDRRFGTYREFLAYAEGATVAPTTIYLLLLTASPDESAAERWTEGRAAPVGPEAAPRYEPQEGFDLVGCGRHFGLFAYLTHILRDLPQDLAAGDRGLLYLAADDLEGSGVTEEMLRRDLARGAASPEVRSLLAELGVRARDHLERGRALLGSLGGALPRDCAFILTLIVAIYEEALDRIEARGCDPFPERHRLGLLDKRRIIARTAREVGFSLGAAAGDLIAAARYRTARR